MGKTVRKIFCTLLVVVMCLTSAPLSDSEASEFIKAYGAGEKSARVLFYEYVDDNLKKCTAFPGTEAEEKGVFSVLIDDFDKNGSEEMVTFSFVHNSTAQTNIQLKLYTIGSNNSVVLSDISEEIFASGAGVFQTNICGTYVNNTIRIQKTSCYFGGSRYLESYKAYTVKNNKLVLNYDYLLSEIYPYESYQYTENVTGASYSSATQLKNAARQSGFEVNKHNHAGYSDAEFDINKDDAETAECFKGNHIFSLVDSMNMLTNGRYGFVYDNIKRKSLCILTTEKSFCVKTNDSMWVAFAITNGDGTIKEKWKKMSVTISDPTVVSLSGYTETDFGYSLEIKGKKEGASNIVVTDTESGLSEEFRVTVYDSYIKSYSYSMNNVPCFFPQNKWENDIATNVYNMNGLYINNYKCNKTGGNYSVSFDVYNERYHTGAVDIFDSNGNWVDSVEIEKYSSISSIWDTGEQIVYLATDLFTGKLISYEQASFTKHTKVTFTVPDGGYFTVSNNFAESIGTFLFNSCEILYEGVSNLIDLVTADSIDISAFSKLIKKEIVDNPVLKKELMKIFVETADKEIRTYTKKILNGEIEHAYSGIAGLLENILNSLDISWKHLFQTATGVGESIFEIVSGPAGLALKGCFSINDGVNKLLQANNLAASTDEIYSTFYSSLDNGFINQHGILISDNGNIDVETVLQVFRISNNDSVEVILNSDDPLQMHELYNICFVKNDMYVQPNGKVKVYIPVPENMQGDTCVVYRQEDDGSWTILHASKEDGYLVFETNHFSLYAIVGTINNIETNTLPDKLIYESYESLDISGLTIKMNDKIIDSGFICNPSVLTGEGNKAIQVNYMGLVTEFEVTVKPHKHTVNDDGICKKCGVDVTEGCSCRCHNDSFFAKLIWKIIIFFQKIFKKNAICDCGIAHY